MSASASGSGGRPSVALAGVAAAFAVAILLGGPLHAALGGLGLEPPFAKVFRYLLLASLCVALGAAFRPWRDVPRDLWGLRGAHARPSLALLGAATALVLLLGLAGLDALAGHLRFDEWAGRAKATHRWPQAIARGILLGLVEECFFRGWLYGRFRRGMPALRAAVVVAAIFGALHAFRESDAPRSIPASPAGALAILETWGANLVDWRDFGPSFLGLALLSLVLTAAYLRWRTLWFGVGLHGAAVAWLPIHSALTMRSVERDWLGSKWLYDGVPGWILLAALAALLWPRGRAADLDGGPTPGTPQAPAEPSAPR